MSGLRQQKKLETWRAIHAAALDLFEDQGFEATTVEQIAAAARVSRATFFNYFASKEAVIFDQDPGARQGWLELMAGRPEGEDLWDALTAVLLGFAESLRDRMPVQRRLKAESPALAQSTQDFGEAFMSDLDAWVASRPTARGEDDLGAALHLNLARAALFTAYQTWGPEEPFDVFLDRARRSLVRARPA